MISLISPFYTLYCQEASWGDRDVNACGNAHPDDKVKAEADPLLCFPCLETNGGVQGKVISCFQVWAPRVCHNYQDTPLLLFPIKFIIQTENVVIITSAFSHLCFVVYIWFCFLQKKSIQQYITDYYYCVVNSIIDLCCHSAQSALF